MADSRLGTEEDQRGRHRSYVPLLVALVLLASSWALAQWGPIRRAPEFEVEQISAGANLLVAGALPWLLQWTGLTFLFLALRPILPTLDRRLVLIGASVPLIVGALWWTSLVVMHWSDNPLEFMLSWIVLAVSQQLGGESLGHWFLNGVIGPLTAPLLLHGPLSMTGWPYIWTGLSTAAAMAIWILIAAIARRLEQPGTLSWKQWLYCGGLLHLWLLPVIIRAVAGVIAASERVAGS